MGMLDRYKKKGGFSQLLQLIETSPKSKQEQFLQLISAESPAWEEAIRGRILTIEKVYSWGPEALSEIISRIQPLQLATALHGMSQNEIDTLLGHIPSISRRKITDLINEANPTPAEKATCVNRILSDVRGFISQGIIKAEKVAPYLIVPDDIEEQLAAMPSGLTSADLEAIKSEVSSKTSSNSVGTTQSSPSGGNSSDAAIYQQEVDFLKRKLNQVLAEVNSLKTENSILKDKLAQIKKIA